MALALAHPQRVKRLAVINGGFEEGAGSILCPALFAASADHAGVAEAMAAAAPRGRSALITDAQEVNAHLASWLSERLSSFDNRELRTAFGSFMTGVTIVTTMGEDGQPRGFTANSFTSVSLEPPLLLICIGKSAASMAVFRQAQGLRRQHTVRGAEGDLRALRLEARRQVRGGALAARALRQSADRGLRRLVRLRALPGDRCGRPHHPDGPHRGLLLFGCQSAGLCARPLRDAGPRAGGGERRHPPPAAPWWAPSSRATTGWC